MKRAQGPRSIRAALATRTRHRQRYTSRCPRFRLRPLRQSPRRQHRCYLRSRWSLRSVRRLRQRPSHRRCSRRYPVCRRSIRQHPRLRCGRRGRRRSHRRLRHRRKPPTIEPSSGRAHEPSCATAWVGAKASHAPGANPRKNTARTRHGSGVCGASVAALGHRVVQNGTLACDTPNGSAPSGASKGGSEAVAAQRRTTERSSRTTR
jgi:hypothetical protein